ncbi:tetrapyrrole-binding protein, chloroplastic-like [Hibiscus syriacus]|uniref:tetrapyrrole-binding protein, chloroplastic-like n=1 Tax=Hibiscus syriacus TaxID=106335 RepID=UPI001921030A|nr:tetrapyrrole-binding protein, chloroplastic-like [Hibiscus syriacus]
MASTSLRNLHHHHHHHCSSFKRLPPPPPPSSLFLKPPSTTTSSTNILSTTSSSSSTTFSLPSSTTSTTTTSSFDTLQHLLSTQNFRQADEETRRLLILLAGEQSQKRGYVFFSEVQYIPETDLKAIDELWRKYSNNKFGYSVQKNIWKKVNKDFTKLFLKLGWMKKLDTEIEQYNYRAFPDEFTWELNDETPEGHLPLTNALRGTRLFNSILSHRAFEGQEEEEAETGENGGLRDGTKPLGNKFLKPNYSF